MSEQSVLLITPQWSRDGGVATHAMASAKLLAEHGVRVGVLSARIEAGAAIPGVTLFHNPALFDPDVSPETKLSEAMGFSPLAVHAHQFEDPDVLAAAQASAPVLISVHGYTACTSGLHYFRPGQECPRAHGPGCVPNLALRGCAHTRHLRWVPAAYGRVGRSLQSLRRADLALSYSSTIDRHLATNGIARRRVIPLFTTMEPAVASGHETRRRVVFAGRVVAPKGVAVLIRAARAVDGEFVICGDGWRLEEMRRLAERLGVAERVRFTGWLAADELARELAEASVVALPALWPEPFGLVGIEAFAAGRPVVASRTGGVVDWLEDGVNGLFVEPGDADALAGALNELLGDPQRQRMMGEAGRRMVSARFAPEHHLSALLKAYREARSTWAAGRAMHADAAVEATAAAGIGTQA